MPQFLLIHGGSHGAWCWEKLIVELDKFGHRAVAFDLPGHGDDPTPRGSVTLQSYVDRVAAFLKKDDSGPWVLVGHSLAGTILPEIAVAFPEKVEAVVFLAAFVLNQGERAIDFCPEERRPNYYKMAEASEDNTMRVTYEAARQLYLNGLPEDEARQCYAQFTPQPLAPFTDAVRVGTSAIPCPARYIACTRDNALGYERTVGFGERLELPVQILEASHDAMLSEPMALAQLLSNDTKNH